MNPNSVISRNLFAIVLVLTIFVLNAQSPYKLSQNFNLGTGVITVSDVITDSSRSYYVVGNASHTTSFNTVPPVIVNGSARAVFVAKLDSTGQMIWVKYWTSDNYQYITSVALSPSGDVLVGGYLLDSINVSNIPQLNAYPVSGETNSFILKFNGSGVFQWMKTFEDSDIIYNVPSLGKIAVGAAGDVYAIGSFSGTVDFDPGPGTHYKTATKAPVSALYPTDIFILKLSAAGEFIWVHQVVGGHRDYGLALALDSQENLIVGGAFQDTVNFNPGGQNGVVGEPLLWGVLPVGHAFIAKFDSTGNFVWVKDFGGFHEDIVWAVELDASDNIYTAGQYSDSADMDPGIGVTFTTAMGADGFVQKLDNYGNLIWNKRFGGAASIDKITDIAVSGNGRVLTTGTFVDSVALNPDSSYYYKGDTSNFSVTGLIELENDGSYRLAQPLTDNYAIGLGVGYSNIESPYIFGRFYDTLDIDPRAAMAHEIYSGKYTNGFFYELQKCPGVRTRMSETVCGSFRFHDSIYTQSGIYTYPLLTANTCDSIVVLNLKVDTVLNGISFKDSLTLQAQDSSASYVWYDCTQDVYLPDDTLRQFSPSDSSQYAVMIKKGACEVMSSCISLKDVSDPEFDNPGFELFPNPVQDYLVITRPEAYDRGVKASARVYSSNGVLVESFGELAASENVRLDFKKIPPGVYILSIFHGGSLSYFKIIKE